MRIRNPLLSVFLVVVFCLSARAQSSRIDGGVSHRNDKFGFYWETRLEPPAPPLEGFSSVTTTNTGTEIIYRIMQDRIRKICFGYQAQVEVLPQANTYRVTFRDLGMTAQEALQFFNSRDAAGWTVLSTSGWGRGTPQTVKAGDVLELELLTNSTTGQKIIDYVTIQEPPLPQPATFGNFNTPAREFAFATGAPRDFRADDAELRIRGPYLSVNGKLESSTLALRTLNTEVSGPVVWVYVPGRGRYVLSLTPHSDLGFRKAGEVRGSTLTFTDGSDALRLVSGGPIAPTQAAFNLYVFHDPAWRPTYQFADLSVFTIGAAERAETLVHK